VFSKLSLPDNQFEGLNEHFNGMASSSVLLRDGCAMFSC
jgi:hypothetical protein